MRIIYAGTPEFAVAGLDALLANGYDVIAVYTQPDRPAGRGRKLTPSPVKQRALDAGIAVYQPASLKGEAEQAELAALNADLMIVAAYGLLLPKAVLDAPRLGCINIHGSLLPRWRGAAPIQRAILAGDTETGITIMQMDVGLDTGDMLVKAALPIGPEATAGEIHDGLARLGGEALIDAMQQLEAGTLKPEKQDDALANYAKKLDKAEAMIDWSKPAIEIDRQVRAFNPWPVAQTMWADKAMRVWLAKPGAGSGDPGCVIHADKTGIEVATGDGSLILLEVQMPGGKRLAARDFLNAHDVTGVCFGD
ncbi:MAG: methionyl-tRNA formyltransferase [Chromatiales bacterium]|nr:methionyl-tRNA formyltransferase [Gammaproteobacteria bacterium]MCP5352186.1 methionyl-tRNA formyltransferase [Chromatiales bacterium]